jgi:hypothetical protein
VRVAGRAERVELSVFRFPDPIARRFSEDGGFEELAFTLTLPAGRPVLPPLPGGEYRAVARRDGREETAEFALTDLIVVIRLAGDDLLLFVADAKTGAPAPGAAVEAGGPGGRVSGRTDSSGVFRTRARLGDRVYAVASQGERLGSADFARPVPARDGPVVWLVTDRPAYAPGETVRFLGLVRTASRGRFLCPEPAGGRFAAFDATGRRIGEGTPVLAPAACFSGSFALDPAAEEGEGRLKVRIAEGAGEVSFRVLPSADPGVAVAIVPLEFDAVAGEELTFRIEASHRWSSWLRGGRLRWEARREDPRRPDGFAPAGSGERALSGPDAVLATLRAELPGRYSLRAEVHDAGGNVAEVATGVTVDPATLMFAIHTDRNLYSRGEEATVLVHQIASVARRGPEEVPVTLHVGPDVHTLGLNRSGRFRLPAEPGPCRIVAEAGDADGRTARDEVTVWVVDGADAAVDGDEIRIVPETRWFPPGEEARFLVVAPSRFLGASLLLTIEGRTLGPHVVEELTSTSRVVSLRLPPELGSRASISAAVVFDGEVAGAWATLPLGTADRRLFPVLKIGALPDPSGRMVVNVYDSGPKPAPASVALLALPLLPLHPRRPPPVLPETFLHSDPEPAGMVPEPVPGTTAWYALRHPGPVSSAPLPGACTAFRTTDAGGLAVFDDLTLPPEVDGWSVHALAVDASSRAGSTARPVAPRAEPTVALRGPAFLRRGDRIGVRAEVRHRAGAAGPVPVTVFAVGPVTGRTEERIDVAPGETVVRETRVRGVAPGNAEVRAGIDGSPQPPAVLRFPVLEDRFGPSTAPWPVPLGARSVVPEALRPTAAGATLFFTIDPEDDPRALVWEALSSHPPPAGPREVALLLRAVLAFRASLPPDEVPEAPLLLDPDGLVERLAALRQEDGGFGSGEASDPADTALVREVLSLARRGGTTVPAALMPEDEMPEGPEEAGAGADGAGAPDAGAPDAEAARARVRALLSARHGPGFDTVEETVSACLDLLEARRLLGPPRPGATDLRVRTEQGILASARLVSGDPFRATLAVPLTGTPDGVVIVEATGDARVLVQCAAPGAGGGAGPAPLRLDRSFRRLPAPDGEVRSGVRPGDLVLVSLRAVSTSGLLRDVVVECPIPAGFAVLPPASFPAIARPPLPPGTRLTRRLDRVLFEVPEVPAEGAEISFLLRPDFRGSFRWPGPSARLAARGSPAAFAPEEVFTVD